MRLQEFLKELNDFLSTFFGCEVKSDIYFGGKGEFLAEGYIDTSVGNYTVKTDKIYLYNVDVFVTDDSTPKLKTQFIEIPFLRGEVTDKVMNLKEALVYIKETIATVKSKVIYENL